MIDPDSYFVTVTTMRDLDWPNYDVKAAQKCYCSYYWQNAINSAYFAHHLIANSATFMTNY